MDVAQYIPLYADASDEHLRALSRNLLTLESDPANQATIGEVFRSAHTLKGMSATMGFDPITDLTHQMEGVLDLVRSGKLRAGRPLVGLLLSCVDSLQEMVQQAVSGQRITTDTAHLRGKLTALRGIPAEAAPGAATTAGASRTEAEPVPAQAPHTLRVDASKLDNLMDLTGELAVARAQLDEICRRHSVPGLAETLQGIGRIAGDLQAVVVTARMCPIGQVVGRFSRMVRDLARAGGKEADLVIRGTEVEVDRKLAEEIGYLLVHLVRNAVDHGVETPDQRAAAGKPRHGTILVEATREGDSFRVVVGDDGAGIDPRKVRERAVSQGLITAAQARHLGDREAVEIVLMPGFSTVEDPTEVSGRGVGLDVVRSKVEALGGSVQIRTAKGEGTTFSVRVPAVCAPVEALVVRVADSLYAIPLPVIDDTVTLAIGGEPELAGSSGRAVRLRSLLGLPDEPPAGPSAAPVVALRVGRRRLDLAVDAVVGRHHLIPRPVPEGLGNTPFASAMAVLGDGSIALILSPERLLAA